MNVPVFLLSPFSHYQNFLKSRTWYIVCRQNGYKGIFFAEFIVRNDFGANRPITPSLPTGGGETGREQYE